MVIQIVLITAVVILAMACMYWRDRAIVAEREDNALRRTVAAERKATASLIRVAGEEMGASQSEIPFLDRYCEFVRRTMRVSGMTVFLVVDDHLEGAAVAGMFPPFEDLPPDLRNQILSSAKHHLPHIRGFQLLPDLPHIREVCERRSPVLLNREQFPSWIPASSREGFGTMVIAPIAARRKVHGIAIVVQEIDGVPLTVQNAEYVTRLSEIAGMCIDGMRTSWEKIEQEQQLRRAHEEGMLQVSTGMVHNIGNAITVAQLITSELIKESLPDMSALAGFLSEEILPALESHQQDGSLADFLANNPQGQEYITALRELSGHLRSRLQDGEQRLEALDNKLMHIIEIIDLQQRFVGELGTEERLALEEPVRHAAMIISESAQKHQVQLVVDCQPTGQVLGDRTMLTQVFLNLLTNALQAFAENGRIGTITVRTYRETTGDQPWAMCSIEDDGPGIPAELHEKIFDIGFTTKQRPTGPSKGLGLHFCRQTVRKYDGEISVKSEMGKGAAFLVRLPL